MAPFYAILIMMFKVNHADENSKGTFFGSCGGGLWQRPLGPAGGAGSQGFKPEEQEEESGAVAGAQLSEPR